MKKKERQTKEVEERGTPYLNYGENVDEVRRG